MIFDNNDGKPPGGPPGPGLHFLKALGHAGLAWAHVAFAEPEDEEDTEAVAPTRRRPRRFKLSGSAGGGTSRGSCCVGKRR